MDRYEIAKQMIDFIIEEKILTYGELQEYATIHKKEWQEALKNKNIAYMISSFIASYREKLLN